ncbi:hypothetical protein FKM82_012567 [Ascaphus truei]
MSQALSPFFCTMKRCIFCFACRCTDINPSAASCTLETARTNKVHIDPIITDLVKGLLPRLQGQVDLLVFNPPYVVTPPEEVGSHGIEAAWAGGKIGREVMDRLFPLVPKLLSDTGLFYLLALKENNPGNKCFFSCTFCHALHTTNIQ